MATEEVGMKWQWSGATITVNDRGEFETVLDGTYTIKKDKLSDVREAIDRYYEKQSKVKVEKVTLNLEVVGRLEAQSWRDSKVDKRYKAGDLFATSVVSINRTDRSIKYDPKVPDGFKLGYVMADTIKNRRRLEALTVAERNLAIARESVSNLEVRGHGRIEPDEYERYATELFRNHAEQLAEVDSDAQAGVQSAPTSNTEATMREPDETRTDQNEGNRETVTQNDEPAGNPSTEVGTENDGTGTGGDAGNGQ